MGEKLSIAVSYNSNWLGFENYCLWLLFNICINFPFYFSSRSTHYSHTVVNGNGWHSVENILLMFCFQTIIPLIFHFAMDIRTIMKCWCICFFHSISLPLCVSLLIHRLHFLSMIVFILCMLFFFFFFLLAINEPFEYWLLDSISDAF